MTPVQPWEHERAGVDPDKNGLDDEARRAKLDVSKPIMARACAELGTVNASA